MNQLAIDFPTPPAPPKPRNRYEGFERRNEHERHSDYVFCGPVPAPGGVIEFKGRALINGKMVWCGIVCQAYLLEVTPYWALVYRPPRARCEWDEEFIGAVPPDEISATWPSYSNEKCRFRQMPINPAVTEIWPWVK